NQDTTTVEIVDSSPTVEFGAVSYTVNEDQGTSMVVEVIRSGDLSFDSHVFLDAVGGDATLGSDYDFNNLVQFYAGESSKFVEINLLNDPEIEPTETFDLEILPGYGGDNYVVGTQNTTTVEIVDTSPTIEIVSDIQGAAITINDTLQTKTLESYGGSQDTPEAIVTYNDNGNEVTIENNGWKDWSIGNNYNITENTILNFEFRSPSQGEIHGIGFDNNESISGSTLFQLYGTQRWGNQAVNNQYSPTDDWKAYSIRVSDYFTGTFDRLVFTNDDDANLGGISQFRNIVLSEEVPTPTNTLPDTLTGLVTTETGTLDADIFVLGDENEAFYDTYGEQDYAEMIGFNAYQDTIQLHGVADDYYIGSSPSGSNDQGIFLQVPGMEDELVGIVKDTINLDLNSNNFVFV
ncbi:MAG: Calx-beta domain-containing protein, partial [Crocosphaera sp.]